MPGKRHISSGSSAPSSREAKPELCPSNRTGAEKPGRSNSKSEKRGLVNRADGFRGPDCSTCSRFEVPDQERFVGPEAVAEYLDIDSETAVRFARLGYIPAHALHVIGKRTHWRFLLSEVRAAMVLRTNTYCA
jgi:hypothetical protein